MKSLRHRVGRWLLRDAPTRTVIRGEKGPEAHTVGVSTTATGVTVYLDGKAIHRELLKLKNQGFGGRDLGLS